MGTPGWAPATRRHSSQTLSAVMSVRFSTVTSSWLMAFKAARTFNRWRPEGAFTKRRVKHQTIPQKGAKTK